MTTILLLVDAFRHDYLNEEMAPYLSKSIKYAEYYSRVEQSLGFCERAEILTGIGGRESGFFTAIGFDPKNSPFKLHIQLKIFHLFESSLVWVFALFSSKYAAKAKGKVRHFISIYLKSMGIKMSPYYIPYAWLKYFSLTEDLIDFRNYESFSPPSIFKALSKNGKSYFYDSFTALNFISPYGSDSERLNSVLTDLSISPKDLYLIYIGDIDSIGHKYGPESRELKDAVLRLDSLIENFIGSADKLVTKKSYVIVGDHGMAEVKTYFDAEKEIKRLTSTIEINLGRDVIFFLDSTMIRFWVINKDIENKFIETLKSSNLFNELGSWMDATMALHYGVPWPDRRYGDYLWCANINVAVFPDFFQINNRPKGMHGYNPKQEESYGLCMVIGDDITPSLNNKIKLHDVYGILMRCLRI